MTPTDEKVDWNIVKRCLTILHRESPTFLAQSLLIGGAACWFYRNQLEAANDPDFKLTPENADDNLWLSKDIDFTGIFRADAYDLLPALVLKDASGNPVLKVGGVRVGFAQVGVTFDPQEAFQRARVGQFQEIQFLVIDPVTLYREKQALAQKRNQPHDHAHLAALTDFLCLEVTNVAADVAHRNNQDLAEQSGNIAFFLDVKKRAPEILNDPRVKKRLRSSLASEAMKFVRDILD